MKGVTGRPPTGARLSVEKVSPIATGEEGPSASPVVYRGFVYLPDADVSLEARVEMPQGTVKVALGEGGTAELQKTAAALIRAATKTEVVNGTPLPRKIVRWRG